MRFLHTADWQIGKPFHSIEDLSKRERLRQQRLETVRGLRALINEHGAAFVVVCGDLFDSFTPDQSTVSALCSAVGSLGVPVYAIPGNHDHAGPGCVWEQPFFQRERADLAPNLHVLLQAQPVVTEEAVLLPCPLPRRHSASDPTAWLRNEPADLPIDRVRVVLAHGSTQGFSSSGESDAESTVNQIDLSRLPTDSYDYIALGDWYGFKEIHPRAWFSGTPEQDRFARGEGNQPGYVLMVDCPGRGHSPTVTPVRTGQIGWHAPQDFDLKGDEDLEQLRLQLESILGQRAGQDLLRLSLTGTLSFSGQNALNDILASYQARLIDLRLEQNLLIEPSSAELDALRNRDDPLVASVAASLQEMIAGSDAAAAEAARDALRELHLQLQTL